MGIEERIAHAALQFSLSEDTTDEEVDNAARILAAVSNPMLDALAGRGRESMQLQHQPKPACEASN